VKVPKLREFSETYFGPHAGYAQQYLFHYMRTRAGATHGRGNPVNRVNDSGSS
jgi:3-methyladenine DNA glycosylase/8-oxoguanine DNA glycosylase